MVIGHDLVQTIRHIVFDLQDSPWPYLFLRGCPGQQPQGDKNEQNSLQQTFMGPRATHVRFLLAICSLDKEAQGEIMAPAAVSMVNKDLEGQGEELLITVRNYATPKEWGAWLRVPLSGAAAEGNAGLVDALVAAGADAGPGQREVRPNVVCCLISLDIPLFSLRALFFLVSERSGSH